jgi:hypothetical protein
MRVLRNCFVVLAVGVSIGTANAQPFKSAYLDANGDVHVVTQEGNDIRVTKSGRNREPLLAADRRTVAWIKVHIDDVKANYSKSEGTVYLFAGGRIKHLRCDPFVRDFWFVDRGSKIGIDCGGLHFAGIEELHDTSSMKLLETMDQSTVPMDKRPAWSNHSGRYSNEGEPQ